MMKQLLGRLRFKTSESKVVMSGYYASYGNDKGLKPYLQNAGFKPLMSILLSRNFISRVSFR